MNRPLCRRCGKPIRKRTVTMQFQRDRESRESHWIDSTANPKSKAEVQRLSNFEVVSIRWSEEKTYITQATVWDGESYVSRFFCTNTCAIGFAHIMARAGHATHAYAEALKNRNDANEKGVVT